MTVCGDLGRIQDTVSPGGVQHSCHCMVIRSDTTQGDSQALKVTLTSIINQCADLGQAIAL